MHWVFALMIIHWWYFHLRARPFEKLVTVLASSGCHLYWARCISPKIQDMGEIGAICGYIGRLPFHFLYRVERTRSGRRPWYRAFPGVKICLTVDTLFLKAPLSLLVQARSVCPFGESQSEGMTVETASGIYHLKRTQEGLMECYQKSSMLISNGNRAVA